MSATNISIQPSSPLSMSDTESEFSSSQSLRERQPYPFNLHTTSDTFSKTCNKPPLPSDFTRNTSLESQRQYKTPAKRLSYLRERKIIGRNEESQIIDGLQYLLVTQHHATFYYLKEKKSKKTIKFRIPYSMELNGITLDVDGLCSIGEKWLVDIGVCQKSSEKDKSQKRIQRSKEAEVNGAFICILDSLGYTLDFKKLKEKVGRKTTPFLKTIALTFPDGTICSIEDVKLWGMQYDLLLNQQDVC
ncbi:hypothetical protein EIN_498380 [Entamoeba invadens IP1]|uniref:Uncharacterized protein n=1 Tax=Entamoeba invadens IP1 TaxID=370355 RepID=A0A0A1UH43_ENTIV|nr:hypothetical protein EIN_498380 [Entamoeba invadens IP1]ELP94638.1 hypothetical protein EIN_498380 [Entamoeba invadens IP1]|eukprot:XP_004261409.1 hypothetical protein EIN_498380 [Entamoeba invadens IP1]